MQLHQNVWAPLLEERPPQVRLVAVRTGHHSQTGAPLAPILGRSSQNAVEVCIMNGKII